MRINAKGVKDSKNVHLCIDAVEYYDQKTDLTAMEKWTAGIFLFWDSNC